MSEPVDDHASRLRAARGRALGAFGITALVCVGAYYYLRAADTPPGQCTIQTDCPGIGHECLRAPTGAYCTHTCDRDEDCDPGTHCDVPPWEKEKSTRTLCIRDTDKIGTK